MSSETSPSPSPAPVGPASDEARGTATIPPSTTTTTNKKAAAKSTKKKTVVKATGAGTQAKEKKPARKKKPSTKASHAPNSHGILQDARIAASDLAQQRAQAAARKADPLWYRIEDVVPAVLTREGEILATTSKKGATPKNDITPTMAEQISILERALTHNGFSRSDVTPQAMACLLEYSRRYTTELIRNAYDYMEYAGRTELAKEDLVLARQDNPVAISTQLPMINALAQQINRKPLPPIPANCYSGILLPPPEHQLTARTFDVISGAVTALRMQNKFPAPPSASTALSSPVAGGTAGTPAAGVSSTKSSTSAKVKPGQPSYGASRGRQIPVKLKTEPTSGNKDSGSSAPGDKTGNKTAPSAENKG